MISGPEEHKPLVVKEEVVEENHFLVWDHIILAEEYPFRATCMYCQAGFQIRGGTSAVLRHLKTHHWKIIDFSDLLPTTRRPKIKAEIESDENDEACSSYMESIIRLLPPSEVSEKLPARESGDEVAPEYQIEQESDQNGKEELNDIRKQLGIIEETIVEDVGVRPTQQAESQCTEKAVKKRKRKSDTSPEKGKSEKAAILKEAHLNNLLITDDETKKLFHESLKATIAREAAMTEYYRMKTKKIELEMERFEPVMMSFLYFLQLVNNWPQMIMLSWNNLINTPQKALEIRAYGNRSYQWNTVDDIQSTISVFLSVCHEVENSKDLRFSWEIYKNQDYLDRSITTPNCSIVVPMSTKIDYRAILKITKKSKILFETDQNIKKPSLYWLAALGDSFSSGQGNPDKPIGNGTEAEWLDETCHRSKKSFPYLAFAKNSAKTPTAFTFLSCSGASVENGILSNNGQIHQLEMIMKKAHSIPNSLILTIGGNDIGFTDILANFQNGKSFGVSIDMRFFYVSHQLDRVAAKLAELSIQKVILVTYYDITRNEHGIVDSSCGLLGKISQRNLQYAERQILQKLNSLLLRKASKYGWLTVNCSDIFRNHGLCSKHSLIRSRSESLLLQGNEYGSFHPNAEAHQLISQRISALL
ncbi:unnamed protein product [Caenorhabditis bovis]|uniref:BED-type domain-containing protein n=1 Tax=Caenorhabditis bovis TaxID=2654633 RepID=A0A8S1EAX1_9PELO|nr:unnamed protein product [Caenorhabditis bovis]